MSTALETLSDVCFDRCREIIKRLAGITLSPERKPHVHRKLQKRASALGHATFQSYFDFMESDAPERALFMGLLTTNETYFMRTPHIWDWIEKTFLPKWYVAHPKEVLQVWSAAASSGEEAHTLGIFCEAFKSRHPDFRYQILGTDISQDMLARCEAGIYSGRSVEGFRSARRDLFEKFLTTTDKVHYQAIPEIRQRVRFERHNLIEAPRFGRKFDLVLLRNVLIYFAKAEQEHVLATLAPALRPDGALIIGESESLINLNTEFVPKTSLIYGKRAEVVNKAA